MINYISYFLFFFGNFLFILFIENSIVQKFLNVYSLSGLIIGPLIFLYFSSEQKSIKLSKTFILLINLSLFYYQESFTYLIIVYALNLFYSDFLSSQSKKIKNLNFIFKLFIFLSVVPFIFDFVNLYELLIIRIFLSSILVIIYLLTNYSYEKIDVKFPKLYLVTTNLSYFGSLFLITIVTKGFILKLIYIFFQICFSIILKLYDLRLRTIMEEIKFNKYFKIIYVVLIFLPLIFLVYNISKIVILIYYSNMVFLYFIKKYLL